MLTVTGSTGTIGAELVTLLSARGVATRALHRRPGPRPLPHVTWVIVDLNDTARLAEAIAGTRGLFLLTGKEPGFGDTQIGVIRAAERVGVAHMVKLSALGASDHSRSTIGREHWSVEQALLGTQMRWTILRPHAFMQNWLGDVAESVRADRRSTLPSVMDGCRSSTPAASPLANERARRRSPAGRRYPLRRQCGAAGMKTPPLGDAPRENALRTILPSNSIDRPRQPAITLGLFRLT